MSSTPPSNRPPRYPQPIRAGRPRVAYFDTGEAYEMQPQAAPFRQTRSQPQTSGTPRARRFDDGMEPLPAAYPPRSGRELPPQSFSADPYFQGQQIASQPRPTQPRAARPRPVQSRPTQHRRTQEVPLDDRLLDHRTSRPSRSVERPSRSVERPAGGSRKTRSQSTVPDGDRVPRHVELSQSRRDVHDVDDDETPMTRHKTRRTRTTQATRLARRTGDARRTRPARNRYEELDELEAQPPRRARKHRSSPVTPAATQTPAVQEPISNEPSKTNALRWVATGAGALVGIANPVIASAVSAKTNGFGRDGTSFMLANGITIGAIIVGTVGLGGVGYAQLTKIGMANKIGLGVGTGIGMLSGVINAAVSADNMTDAVVINYIAVASGLGGLALPAAWKALTRKKDEPS